MTWLQGEVSCEACGGRYRAVIAVAALALDAWCCKLCGEDGAHLSGPGQLLAADHPEAVRAESEEAVAACEPRARP